MLWSPIRLFLRPRDPKLFGKNEEHLEGHLLSMPSNYSIGSRDRRLAPNYCLLNTPKNEKIENRINCLWFHCISIFYQIVVFVIVTHEVILIVWHLVDFLSKTVFSMFDSTFDEKIFSMILSMIFSKQKNFLFSNQFNDKKIFANKFFFWSPKNDRNSIKSKKIIEMMFKWFY